jgi:hypothetical protein
VREHRIKVKQHYRRNQEIGFIDCAEFHRHDPPAAAAGPPGSTPCRAGER